MFTVKLHYERPHERDKFVQYFDREAEMKTLGRLRLKLEDNIIKVRRKETA
jgi:hypothetical protein